MDGSSLKSKVNNNYDHFSDIIKRVKPRETCWLSPDLPVASLRSESTQSSASKSDLLMGSQTTVNDSSVRVQGIGWVCRIAGGSTFVREIVSLVSMRRCDFVRVIYTSTLK